MEKLKVYLDTSVISHLLQEDVPEKMTASISEQPLSVNVIVSYPGILNIL